MYRFETVWIYLLESHHFRRNTYDELIQGPLHRYTTIPEPDTLETAAHVCLDMLICLFCFNHRVKREINVEQRDYVLFALDHFLQYHLLISLQCPFSPILSIICLFVNNV